ncbi:Endochitinase PR4 [Smittium mucronatum]|uniref:Endochitinase PR4 n=1 Tax=Smittium mucronatum TaxID=133383 RepID=A0A1R0GP95_9FUNG|nr:Endochitinase PR4 [Smittium mucronatum]OLY82862.1 Endochitinase PR4 [Smittium mucronatum]
MAVVASYAVLHKRNDTQEDVGGIGLTCKDLNLASTSNQYDEVSEETCADFLNNCEKFQITSKVEAAMIYTNIIWESGGFRYNREILCESTDCSLVYPPSSGYYTVDFGGRGYIQLTWLENYKAASDSLYGDDRLVQNPDLVIDEQVNWDVTFWYWNTFVHIDPGVQEGHFGSSINMINGALECRGEHQDIAQKRFDIYTKVLSVFDSSATPDYSGCLY